MNSPKIQIKLVLRTEDVATLSILASREGLSLKSYIKKVIAELVANFYSDKKSDK